MIVCWLLAIWGFKMKLSSRHAYALCLSEGRRVSYSVRSVLVDFTVRQVWVTILVLSVRRNVSDVSLASWVSVRLREISFDHRNGVVWLFFHGLTLLSQNLDLRALASIRFLWVLKAVILFASFGCYKNISYLGWIKSKTFAFIYRIRSREILKFHVFFKGAV